MNILFLCDEYPPGRHGGIGTAVQLLARTLADKGHKVVVAGFYDWSYGEEDEFTDNGVLVHRFRRMLPRGLFRNPDALLTRVTYRLFKSLALLEWDIKRSLKKYHSSIEDLIAKHDIDIVEMPDYNDYMRFCNSEVPFPELSVPTIVKLHGSMSYFSEEAGEAPASHIKQMEHKLLYQASGVVSVSDYTAKKTAQYLDYNKSIEVLYNGIDMPSLSKKPEKEKGLVVFTGSLVHKKGIYQLIKAWNEVAVKVDNAKLVLFGKGAEDKLKALLTTEAASTVNFMGHVSRAELYDYLTKASVAIFPSYAETFGLGPVEAMACGTATIFSTRTSGPEILEDGVSGYLVDPDDVKSISARLITLLTNEDLQMSLAQAGQLRVQQKFSIEHIADEHIKYYTDIISRS